MNSLLKAEFVSRFIENGRVLSQINGQKQRVTGRVENTLYIALYNPVENKWALVRNSEAGYPCYTLDSKGTPMVLYVDRAGNVRERIIKQEMLLDILDNSIGSQDFRDNLRTLQNNLKGNYNLSFVKPSLGYDMDIPYSCQKGKGSYFKWLDDIAKMAILRDNRDNIIARCLIWDKENIEHKGEPCSRDIADRLYANDGLHKVAIKNELKKLGIESIWESDRDRPFEYQEYILKLPESVQDELNDAICYIRAPFMDSFNHYNRHEGLLYSFHWVDRLNHSDFEWDGSVDNVLLYTDGEVYIEDEDDRVWDDYNEERIDRDDAVEPINYDGVTHRDSCIYSDYHDGYLIDDGDVIAVRTPGGYGDYDYTYHGSGVELIEINDEVYFLDEVRRYRA